MEDIEELIRKHDDYQFEVKLGYDLNRDKKADLYRVETFFFLPNNLDVNESTYTRKQFYRDFLLYIRFKTPEFSLAALLDPANRRSPLQKVRAVVEAVQAGSRLQNPDSLEYEIKLLGCVLKSSLRDRVNAIRRSLRSPNPPPPDLQRNVEDFARQTRRVAQAFRLLKGRLDASKLLPRLLSSVAFTDEYISLLIEGHTHRLLQALYRESARPLLEAVQSDLAALIQDEVAYRRAAGYPSLVSDRSDNEVFLFRLSVLKKFVSQILFLSVRTMEEGKGLKEFALAMAAGIAMVFAAGVAFYYQKAYGTLSFSFFAALVISYMFKDRIKAFFQNYFQRALARRLFDQQTAIYEPFTGEKIGVCREMVHFTDEGRIDPRVTLLRDRDHITEIENDWRSERVLCYAKEILLRPRALVSHHGRQTALTDIARFNIRNFLLKMDQPQTEVFFLRDGRSEAISGTRVYHVNLVIKFTSQAEIFYQRIRLVLTRNGIKRIESVGSEKVDREAAGL